MTREERNEIHSEAEHKRTVLIETVLSNKRHIYPLKNAMAVVVAAAEVFALASVLQEANEDEQREYREKIRLTEVK